MPCISFLDSEAPPCLRLPGALGEWTLRHYDLPDGMREWPDAPRPDDRWLSASTLGYLATHLNEIETSAVHLAHADGERQVWLTVQSFLFRSGRQIRPGAGGRVSRWDIRRRLLSLGSTRVLCIGQLLTSGDYALAVRGVDADLLNRLLVATADALAGPGCGYGAVLLKDIHRGRAAATYLTDRQFHPLPADPVMLLDLRPFADREDYLERLSSKYRIRYRRARGKLDGIIRRPLSAQRVRRERYRLHALYRATSHGADVNVVNLEPDYFTWLALTEPVYGYFAPDGRLVGFTTALSNGPVYQAHYLGLEEAYKYSHHLYHNMLFDHLEDALAGGFERLDYGRTAPEIKSSVGAEPVHFTSYLRLRSSVLNRCVPHFVPALFTPAPWQSRSPFRQA